MSKFRFKLFITGKAGKSERAILNLHSFCENYLAVKYDIKVIDVLEQPEMAEQEKILATPTLIKVAPKPQRRIVGDLSNVKLLSKNLDLNIEPM